jgi:AraC-like DNA-binding protein
MESGEAQLLVEGADSRVLRAGDVALLPAGHRHVLRVGTETARWLTGTFALEGGRQDRLHRDLPTVIAFEALCERGYEWFDVSYRMLAKERSEPTPGAAVMISRILDLMYIQMKQVAHRVGFASDAAFNRAFSRRHGRTPAQWRTDRAAHGSRGRGAVETDSVQ